LNASDTELSSCGETSERARVANFELKLFLPWVRNWNKAIAEAGNGTMQLGDDKA
jgi:hypothetical protein